MKHELKLTVRSTDVDMIGHVNHAKYLEYLEWARFQWLRDLGLTMGEMKKRGLLPVVVHVSIDYRKELLVDEEVTVISQPLRLGNKSNRIKQQILNQKGEVAAEAEITSLMIDAATRRATDLPEEWKQLFKTG